MGELRTLYPEINENFSKMLKVDDVHTIYYEESGNPQGIPVVFLHGGLEEELLQQGDATLTLRRIELFN